jgi:glycosyltransferase involved in cell wall biosynthesis
VTAEARSSLFRIEYFEPVRGTHELPTVTYCRRLWAALPTYDLVHLHSLWNGVSTLTAWFCRRTGTPYVLSPRGMLQSVSVGRRRLLKGVYHRLLEQRTISGSAALHFVSQVEAAESAAFLTPETRRLIIPNGVAAVNAHDRRTGKGAFRREHPSLQGRRIVLFVGRVHWSKGLWLQAEALPALIRRVPRATWVLLGPDAGERGRLEAWLAIRGLEDHVYWAGEVPHAVVMAALADADVFVLTSLHEAQSVALSEALGAGTPIVACAAAAFADLDGAGAAALVPRDAAALANVMAEILESPSRAQALGEAAKQFAADVLTWPRIAREMRRGYEEVIAAFPPGLRRAVGQ